MSAAQYAEVVGNPYEVWVAAVGTTAPVVDAAPSGSWSKLGVNGKNNQGSDGVTVGLNQTVQSFTPAGSTVPVKDWRTDEAVSVAFSLADTTPDTVSKVLDNAAITTTAAGSGVAGEKHISLIRGVSVVYFALLVRGISPYDDGTGAFVAQYEFGRVCQSGSQSIKHLKGTPAEVACEFAIRGTVSGTDTAIWRAQNAAAL